MPSRKSPPENARKVGGLVQQVVWHGGTQGGRGIEPPGYGGHRDFCGMRGFDVAKFVADIESVGVDQIVAADDVAEVACFAEQVVRGQHEIEFGQIVVFEEAAHIFLGIGRENTHERHLAARLFQHFGNTFDWGNVLQAHPESAFALDQQAWQPPWRDPEKPPKLAHPHVADVADLLGLHGAESILPGQLVEDRKRLIEGVGKGAVEIKDYRIVGHEIREGGVPRYDTLTSLNMGPILKKSTSSVG